MRAHASTVKRLTVYLEGDERFQWETPTGRILVDRVTFDEHGHESNAVTFRGMAIKKKTGETGFINRSGSASLRDVPSEIILYALAELRNIQMESREKSDALEGS